MNLWKESHELSTLDLVGGKGLHLQKLMQWGAHVAPFFVVTTESFSYYQTHHALAPELEDRFNDFFENHSMIALRSSMIAEDQQDSSFAGLFETLLNVTQLNWRESLIQIFESVHSNRVTEYMDRKNIQMKVLMAVVVQELITVDKSGVLFSRSPVEPTSAIAIDAAFGMGEGVVSGHSEVDHYLFTRGFDLIHKVNNNSSEVLNAQEIKKLLIESLMLESNIKMACDIEWGFRCEELFIFQIRPITRAFEPLSVLVDTNLSESYPGTVSPFTALFVQKAYENVFIESAIALGASPERLKVLKPHYAKLISHVDGHLYYHLEHYYAVLRALPGGDKNIDNWHKMIGGELQGMTIPYHDTKPSSVEIFSSAISMLKMIFNRKKVFFHFLSDLEKLNLKIEKEQKELRNSHETIFYMQSLLSRPMGFGLTVVNDIFVMIGLALLSRSLKKRGISEESVIDILKTSEGIDSLKPLHFFDSLVTNLSPEFIQEMGQYTWKMGVKPYEDSFLDLSQKGFGTEVQKLQNFLNLYGDRSFEELKLESLPLKNNPALFYQLMKWAKNNPSLETTRIAQSKTVDLNWFENYILKFTRDSIAMREATRLWRGRFYHHLRSLVLKLAEQLPAENEIWSKFEILDFFSVNHEEWQLGTEAILPLIESRRNWQTKTQAYPEIIQWVESEKLPIMNVAEDKGEIHGQGVSSGQTQGWALVLENPSDALSTELKDFILVTKNTDPAWVYIMSRSLGLISEKGSLLSHTAIIGRELSIPTIVGVRGATHRIKTGDRIQMDAQTGKITIL